MSSLTTVSPESVSTTDLTLNEAVQKRDAYISTLRQQLEFYKQDRSNYVAQQRSKHDENREKSDGLIELHIAEMRELRTELEQSIRNNDALRTELEHRLSQTEKEVKQFKDPQMRASLLRENDNLRARIQAKDVQIESLQAEVENLKTFKNRSVVFFHDKKTSKICHSSKFRKEKILRIIFTKIDMQMYRTVD